MKATGMVRRIDNLGRMVIPKEIRRTLRIREGDSLAIFVNHEGEVILKKYSPVNEMGDFAKKYTDSIYEAIGHIACITDRDQVIAVSGDPKKKFLNKRIGSGLEDFIQKRKALIITEPDQYSCFTFSTGEEVKCGCTTEVIAPIIVEGYPIGAVIIASRRTNIVFGDLELKSAVTAASFLAKQMEL